MSLLGKPSVCSIAKIRLRLTFGVYSTIQIIVSNQITVFFSDGRLATIEYNILRYCILIDIHSFKHCYSIGHIRLFIGIKIIEYTFTTFCRSIIVATSLIIEIVCPPSILLYHRASPIVIIACNHIACSTYIEELSFLYTTGCKIHLIGSVCILSFRLYPAIQGGRISFISRIRSIHTRNDTIRSLIKINIFQCQQLNILITAFMSETTA